MKNAKDYTIQSGKHSLNKVNNMNNRHINNEISQIKSRLEESMKKRLCGTFTLKQSEEITKMALELINFSLELHEDILNRIGKIKDRDRKGE